MSDSKTLLPELLPAPRPETQTTPRQRVLQRAGSMLDRLRDYKVVAGAALLATHCKFGVVDPLPPPPQQCANLSDPFNGLQAFASTVASDGGQTNLLVELTNYRAIGYNVDATRVSGGGILVSTVNRSDPYATILQITIAPDGSSTDILLDVDLSCGGASITKRYRVSNGAVTER